MKLLVADDEEFARECISKQINWAAYDIDVVGTAVNGQEAWKQIQEKSPDCVITDIKMPLMSGIELLEKIASQNLDIDVIIISGFDEFEFAQKALNLGAKSFLLKPIDATELLNKVIEIQEKRKTEKEKFIQDKSEESYIRNLIYLVYTPEELDEIREKMSELWDYWQAVILLRMDDINEALSIGKTNVYREILRRIRQYCIEKENCYLLEKSPHNMMFCTLADAKDKNEKITFEIVNLIQEVLKQNFYENYVVGVSNINHTMEEAGKSYLEANRAINMKYIYGSDKIYYAGEERTIQSGRKIGLSNELENNIIENTVYFNEIYVDELTNQLFEQQETGRITVEDLQQSIYRITIGVISHDALINLDISSLYSDTGFIITTLCKCKDLRECKTKLKSFLHTIGRRLNEVKIKMPNQTIQKIKKYIETYYAVPELSLSQIAEEFCFSPAYLSTLFKKNCSQNITDYINTVRIDQACSLLEMGEDKISLISEKVGYSNTSYFYKVFKRIKGCPPKDYRERIGI